MEKRIAVEHLGRSEAYLENTDGQSIISEKNLDLSDLDFSVDTPHTVFKNKCTVYANHDSKHYDQIRNKLVSKSFEELREIFTDHLDEENVLIDTMEVYISNDLVYVSFDLTQEGVDNLV